MFLLACYIIPAAICFCVGSQSSYWMSRGHYGNSILTIWEVPLVMALAFLPAFNILVAIWIICTAWPRHRAYQEQWKSR